MRVKLESLKLTIVFDNYSHAKGLEELDFRFIAPTHCTGDHAIRLFREKFGERCFWLGSGRVIKLEDLE